MTNARSQTKAEQRAMTTAKLIKISRELFAELGYAQTPTEEVVRRAGVTRGALYHHFGSKEGLFHAVVVAIQQELAEQIVANAEQAEGLWQQLLEGCRAFLQASLDPEVQQILLVDAPAVLGNETWRQIDAEYSREPLAWVLGELEKHRIIQTASVTAAVHLLSGAMNEAALWIAQAKQPDEALEQALQTLAQMLDGFRVATSDV